MILGLVIGLLIGALIGAFISAYTDSVLSFFVSSILLMLIGGSIGIQVDRVSYDKKIANWENTKMIIEDSLKDEKLSQLEKINLVNTIVGYNMQLTELKEDVKQWWYFYLDDSKVNELEIIKINEESE